MPTYRYICKECRAEKEEWHGMSDAPEISCDSCGIPMVKSIGSNNVGTLVRGTTPAKAWKEKRRRAKESAKREVRKLERWGGTSKVLPNYDGQEVSSWTEAKKMAKDAGGDASRYDSYIRKEKDTKNSAGVEESKWKNAKDAAKKA